VSFGPHSFSDLDFADDVALLAELLELLVRTGLTIWWALRTPQRRGSTGKLDAEEEEGWEGCPSPQPARGHGERCLSFSSGSGRSPGRKRVW